MPVGKSTDRRTTFVIKYIRRDLSSGTDIHVMQYSTKITDSKFRNVTGERDSLTLKNKTTKKPLHQYKKVKQ